MLQSIFARYKLSILLAPPPCCQAGRTDLRYLCGALGGGRRHAGAIVHCHLLKVAVEANLDGHSANCYWLFSQFSTSVLYSKKETKKHRVSDWNASSEALSSPVHMYRNHCWQYLAIRGSRAAHVQLGFVAAIGSPAPYILALMVKLPCDLWSHVVNSFS